MSEEDQNAEYIDPPAGKHPIACTPGSMKGLRVLITILPVVCSIGEKGDRRDLVRRRVQLFLTPRTPGRVGDRFGERAVARGAVPIRHVSLPCEEIQRDIAVVAPKYRFAGRDSTDQSD